MILPLGSTLIFSSLSRSLVHFFMTSQSIFVFDFAQEALIDYIAKKHVRGAFYFQMF